MEVMRKWLKAATVRAVKTAAQAALGVIGASAIMGDVMWPIVGSAALLAAIVSYLTSIAGIKEVDEGRSLPYIIKNDIM